MTSGALCGWHKLHVDHRDAVLVGSLECGSVPPNPIWACRACVQLYDLLPLAEHPVADGRPRYRDGRLVHTTSPVVQETGA